ncbi:metallophosphoesterase [Pelagicoccus mobilis]|uniref:Metallophosphoesterase n=1 Tax=Pelagicoccus mobilis TaxID=415221 RepID=A0A934RZZ3_9BACT|nr:metallophosphoesterase [Pelagicoccus mobilis]MBK1879842.1 metallophosphoesterase [Pelagicoccus mobilis]
MKRLEIAVEQINEAKPDFVALCGDMVHNANEQSFADFKKIQAGLEVPCYCVPGNHDIKKVPTRESLAFYRKHFGEDYYAFEHKGYFFAFINTQFWKSPTPGESAKHDAWFEDQLTQASSKGLPVFVVGHYPLYVKDIGEEEKNPNLPVAKRKEVLDLYRKYGVVAMLGGHTHHLVQNEVEGIQLFNAETTSKNFDKRPFGFRLWHVDPEEGFQNEFVALDDLV